VTAVRSYLARWWTYERRWYAAMMRASLGAREGPPWRRTVPAIRRVVSTPSLDRVLVAAMPGQQPEDFERAADELARAFGRAGCRVREDRPGRLWLEFT
jgi:S-DNA-T family DNA segregation ATPase FtsK/SpoIIIE